MKLKAFKVVLSLVLSSALAQASQANKPQKNVYPDWQKLAMDEMLAHFQNNRTKRQPKNAQTKTKNEPKQIAKK